MATTLYPRHFGAGEPKPNAKQSTTAINFYLTYTGGGGQDGAGAIYPIEMNTMSGTLVAQTASDTDRSLTKNTNYYEWVKAFISPPLRGAQTIAGTFTMSFDFYESAVGKNTMPRVFIYIWKANDTLGGTLLADTNSGTEADTTANNQQTFFSGQALSSQSASDGDRIVIEVMGYIRPGTTTTYNDSASWGGSGGNLSYFQFSQDLKFYPGGSAGFTISDTIKSKSKFVRKLTQAIKVAGLVQTSVVSGGQTFARVCIENLVSGWGGVKDVLVRKRLVRKLSQGFTLSVNVLTIGPPSVLSVVCIAQLTFGAFLKTYKMIRIVLVLSRGP